MSHDARDLPDDALDAAMRRAANPGEAYELSQNRGINPMRTPTLGDVVNRRLGRRSLLQGMLASTALLAETGSLLASFVSAATAADAPPRFNFKEVPHGVDQTHHVAEGYTATVLIRWGDPVLPGAPDFDPRAQSADKQAMQMGYNCDYVGFASLPYGSNSADHGLLCINHEYANATLMFPGIDVLPNGRTNLAKMTREFVDIEMASHGGTVVEIRRDAQGRWSYVKDSKLNRRITMFTEIALSGPAAGHERLRTTEDPSGRVVKGMVNNCAGGMTPWGTWLSGEENFHGYFQGKLAEGHAETAALKRYGVPEGWYDWGRHHERMDISKEPREPNRFGWIVETDPYDPAARPIKRTALGRFKHEGAESIINKDGRLVVYMGDDERFEYLYKFVSRDRVNVTDRAANARLLDEGTLYVARVQDDGTGTWLPLVWGTAPLTPENGFASQADVLIEARRAGDVLGATPMDRPEDVEPNPRTGKVYLALTNNERRKADDADPRRRLNKANPREINLWGQLIELTNPDDDHAATSFRWEMLVLAGDPQDAKVQAVYHPETSRNGWFACPDNLACDHAGRLWVGTDQGIGWARASNTADGIWAVETHGPLRGYAKQFWRNPIGAEICGICFLPDDRTMTVAVQHPAADGTKDFKGFERESTYDDPATRWPDFKPDMPPRPSVVLVTKDDGGPIGT